VHRQLPRSIACAECRADCLFVHVPRQMQKTKADYKRRYSAGNLDLAYDTVIYAFKTKRGESPKTPIKRRSW
jgi:hypothetical protein